MLVDPFVNVAVFPRANPELRVLVLREEIPGQEAALQPRAGQYREFLMFYFEGNHHWGGGGWEHWSRSYGGKYKKREEVKGTVAPV
jgi:hypothetical protein